MKKVIAYTLIMFMAVIFIGCGSDSPPVVPPPDPPPVIQNTVDFSCVSVDNDFNCSGILEDGTWNSGAVQISGQPMPQDWLNLEIINNMTVNATIFVEAEMTIDGCDVVQFDPVIRFDIIELNPAETATFSVLTWNYRCGLLGYQDGLVSIYNAAGSIPELIANSVVIWDNRLPGDM